MSVPPTSSDPSDQSTVRDAACVVVIDGSGRQPTLLMGRRHADQVFLPRKWVFPGGRVDADDRELAVRFSGAYAPPDLAPEIRPFALAAVRELCEETGFVIGRKEEPFTGRLERGWRDFAAAGLVPSPAQLLPLARAITPPGRVRRYDTWFFMAKRQAISDTTTIADGELLDLDWFTLGQARKLDLPNITKLVLEDVAARLDRAPDLPDEQLPFYYSDACGFRRTLISCRANMRRP
jgi:8-oxo-dGTP pyrophosphatase MutT (NUDIX family)